MNLLLIGNKPYLNIDISDIIDDFDKNIRFNMHIINNNNGKKCDELSCCAHVFLNLKSCFCFKTNKHKKNNEYLINIYKHAYVIENINFFYNNFKPNLYSKIYTMHEEYSHLSVNKFLKSINCPFTCRSLPRTGFTTLIYKLYKNNNKIFVTHFSIKNEIRRSFMCSITYEKLNIGTGCHKYSHEDEANILMWLHKENYIDITLCMLEDTNIPTLNCKGLIPSEYILNKLKLKFGNVIIN
jgi:hypothetical protein